MRIGAVADAAGVPTQTIRFYERKGLLPAPRRNPNGYRDYDASTLTRLAFIRSAQTAGLTLVEITSILDLRRDGANPCTHVHSLLQTKLDEVRVRQEELTVLEAELKGLIRRSERLDPADCSDAQICQIITSGDGDVSARPPSPSSTLERRNAASSSRSRSTSESRWRPASRSWLDCNDATVHPRAAAETAP